MTEVAIAEISKDAPVSLEVPKHTVLLTLPSTHIDVVGMNIRLAMHTDSVMTLLRTLSAFPDLDQLRIEGRVLNEEQKEALEQSQMYKFYLSGRISRIGFSLPTSLGIEPGIIAALIQSPVSPASLEEDIGYKIGYFNAGNLVKQWISGGRPNDLLPIIGGVNELHLGSDTLSSRRLFAMATTLQEAFVQQEQSVRPSTAYIKNTPGFTQYNIQTLFPQKYSNNFELNRIKPNDRKNGLEKIQKRKTY